MIIYDFEQRTPEWFEIRRGKITGTRLAQVFKSDNMSLLDELIAEMVSEELPDNYQNAAMLRGSEMEPYAREHYELKNDVVVAQMGFIQSDKYPWLGMSPDGLVMSEGKYKHGLEIKCPDTKTHVRYLRQNQIPNEYKYQVYSPFLINEDMESHDFVSFDPRFVAKPMFTKTIFREDIKDELYKTECEAVKFWAKVMDYYEKVTF